ncbi:MAG: restriction endonuclease [Desulfobacterales bacterium]
MKKNKLNRGHKSKETWRLVEQIVATVFESADVQVQRNVRLRAVRRRGGQGGTREIDVLITGRLAGQTIPIPIECKHHDRKTDSSAIDAFIGKLLDVGLPTQTSIFVSTAGFTRPATERAQEVGMRTLILSGTDFRKTKDKVLDAIQSHIFMACSLKQLSYQTVEATEPGSFDHMQFFDAEGSYRGSIPDFLWESWINGVPPLMCGRYKYDLEIPEEWTYLADGRKNSIHNIKAEFQVVALTFRFRGETKTYNLIDALTNSPERQTVQVRFSLDGEGKAPKVFETEEALNEFLSAPVHAHVTIGRIRLPKLVMNQGLLWPVPSAVINQLNRLHCKQPEKSIESLAATLSKSSWDFDETYADFLKRSRSGLKINIRVQAT